MVFTGLSKLTIIISYHIQNKILICIMFEHCVHEPTDAIRHPKKCISYPKYGI